MRAYPIDSPYATGRILALMMIVDGHVAAAELEALYRCKILDHIDLDPAGFQRLMHDLCDDLMTSTSLGAGQPDIALIDSLLAEVAHPDLRRKLLRAMWRIADADGWLSDSEAVLLTRASKAWSAETNFKGNTSGTF